MWNAAPTFRRPVLCALAAGVAAIFAAPSAALGAPGNGNGPNGKDHVAPSAPSNLLVSAVSMTSITVTWTASTDRFAVTGYNLFRDHQNVGTTTATSDVFDGFACGTGHDLGVQAFDAAGNLSQVTTITASTAPCPDTVPPSGTSSVVETASTTTSISLFWSPSTDNVGVAGYDVFVNGVKAGTSVTTSFTAGGLKCGTVYYLGVDAYDAAGNHSITTTVIGSTSPCPVVVYASPPTDSSPPTITGTAQEGQTLSATTGTWTGSPTFYAYQWQRCDSSGGSCSAITGATATSYVLTASNVGSTLRVSVTATNAGGSATAVSAQTPVVAAVPSSGSKSSIYWGAYVEGAQTYGYLYGGTWSNAPWCDSGTQCALPKFDQNAGKQIAVEHWGMCWTCGFDTDVAKLVVGRGDIPAVDWSTSGVSDADVASGKYDGWLTTQAKAMASFGHPLFVLFDEEMNGTWYSYSPGLNGNTAADFVAMWRHVHDVFASNGATNVTWVWCPNVDPDHVFTSYSELYPGDAYVDWTGLNGYNWGGHEWTSFANVFSSSYNALLQLAPTKPIMIGETASAEVGGSKAAWITDALSTQLPQNFPQVKAVLWFNWLIYEKSTWWPWEVESSASSQQAFATAISSPYYAAGGSFANLPLLTKVQPLQ